MSTWEKPVTEGQLRIADTSSKKMPLELFFFYLKNKLNLKGLTVLKR